MASGPGRPVSAGTPRAEGSEGQCACRISLASSGDGGCLDPAAEILAAVVHRPLVGAEKLGEQLVVAVLEAVRQPIGHCTDVRGPLPRTVCVLLLQLDGP